jgi:hypothetical protein
MEIAAKGVIALCALLVLFQLQHLSAFSGAFFIGC